MRRKILDDHPVVIATLKQKYQDIETLFANTQNDIEALQLIKEKIIHCEKYSKYLIQDANHNESDKLSKNANSMESLLNGSPFNSFNLMSESVLCSTKLEMDNSTRYNIFSFIFYHFFLANFFLLRRENRNPKIVLPQYVNEISLLMDVPIQQFYEISAEKYASKINA